jgi:hypothetical protein
MSGHGQWWVTESVWAGPAKRRWWTSGTMSRRSVLHKGCATITWSRSGRWPVRVHCSGRALQGLTCAWREETMLHKKFGKAWTSSQHQSELFLLPAMQPIDDHVMRMHACNSECTQSNKSAHTTQHVCASCIHMQPLLQGEQEWETKLAHGTWLCKKLSLGRQTTSPWQSCQDECNVPTPT